MSTPTPSPVAGPVILHFQRIEYIRAKQLDTINGAKDGSLDAALDAEDQTTLANHLVSLRCSPHWANPVFGGAFRSWMDRVKRALIRRGITALEVHGAFLSPRIIELQPEGCHE